jgi:small-conductance mechanosensitive channel
MEFLAQEYLDNSVQQYLYAVAVAIGIGLGVHLVRILIMRRMRQLAAATDTSIDDLVCALIAHTRMLVVLVLAISAGASMLVLPSVLTRFLPVLAKAVLLIQIGIWGVTAVRVIIERQRSKKASMGEPDTFAAFGVIGVLGRGAVWAVVFLLLLDNFGVDVTALVTGLGIGGVAVALAVQKILSDLFASVSIVLDKPFQVGDLIVLDTFVGTVEEIGLKTTRVKSLSGERIVFSNSDLVNARLRNFKQLQERRVVFTFGVVYETPVEQIEAIPGLVRAIVEAQAKTRFDRAHFTAYGDSALLFEVVYYVTDPDYTLYLDIQQAINLGIMRALQARQIGFAYPTQMVYVHLQEPAGPGNSRISAGSVTGRRGSDIPAQG